MLDIPSRILSGLVLIHLYLFVLVKYIPVCMGAVMNEPVVEINETREGCPSL